MRKALALIAFFLPLLVLGKPVSIYIEFEGKKLKANAEWAVPEGVKPEFAILWLHGLFQTHSMMEPISQQREFWVSEGFPVLSPTLTLGVNDRKSPYDCSYPLDHPYELNIEEIKRWVDWLKGQGVKRIILAGHSMGSQQVVHTAQALQKDEAVAGVLAVAPAKGTPRKHPLLSKARELVNRGQGRKLLRTSFFYCSSAKISARTLYTYYSVDRNIGRSLKRLNIPVLIVWGGEDDRVENLPEFLEPYVKGKENIRIEVIDYADHFFRDLAAEDLRDLAVEFFRKVFGQHAGR